MTQARRVKAGLDVLRGTRTPSTATATASDAQGDTPAAARKRALDAGLAVLEGRDPQAAAAGTDLVVDPLAWGRWSTFWDAGIRTALAKDPRNLDSRERWALRDALAAVHAGKKRERPTPLVDGLLPMARQLLAGGKSPEQVARELWG
jgi:hypothetical protein